MRGSVYLRRAGLVGPEPAHLVDVAARLGVLCDRRSRGSCYQSRDIDSGKGYLLDHMGVGMSSNDKKVKSRGQQDNLDMTSGPREEFCAAPPGSLGGAIGGRICHQFGWRALYWASDGP